MFPLLPKSYKNAFPFKIGTTSYIYPDNILPNVRHVGPYVDEIELLLFESTPKESLPTQQDIQALKTLSTELNFSFNVHLPIDIFLGSRSEKDRHHAVETLKWVIDLTAPITPTTHTLHLEGDLPSYGKESIERWQDTVSDSLARLLSSGISAESISIETLSYPFQWVEMIINEFNLSVCIDLGHLLKRGVDAEKIYASHKDKVVIVHLHGVDKDHDHKPLDKLSRQQWAAVMKMLKQYNGVVSLEVFSFDHLVTSLKVLEEHWQNVCIHGVE